MHTRTHAHTHVPEMKASKVRMSTRMACLGRTTYDCYVLAVETVAGKNHMGSSDCEFRNDAVAGGWPDLKWLEPKRSNCDECSAKCSPIQEASPHDISSDL